MENRKDLRILLIGYGKMGRAIEQVARERGHTIVACVSDKQGDISHICKSYQPNIAFEFTSPDSAPSNIRQLIESRIPVVCGSTGWLSEWETVKNLVLDHKGAFFYASNFSLGMNLLFHLAEATGRFMEHHPDYDVSIEEIHHTEKKDMPSGTAITLAERLMRSMRSKKSWKLNAESSKDSIGISAIRQANVPGTHIVTFSSAVDTIQLSHTAHSRMGFASGAIHAGEWLLGKTGVFSMEDLLREKFF
jgi:4-hydroxy-tetrahydrodipicolinate reductase